MEGGFRASVFDTTSGTSVASSKNADLAAIYATLAPARSPNRACHPMGPHMDPLGPKALQMDPRGVPRWPKGFQMLVRGSPKHPKGRPKLPQKRPKGIPEVPHGLPHGSPGAQGGPNRPQRCPKTVKVFKSYIYKLPINRPSGQLVHDNTYIIYNNKYKRPARRLLIRQENF